MGKFSFEFAFFYPIGCCDVFKLPSSLLKLIENKENPGDCDVGELSMPFSVSRIPIFTLSENVETILNIHS